MKEVISIKKRNVLKHKEQRWVEFEIEYKTNGQLKKKWIPIESSTLDELKGKKLNEYLTERI